MTSIAPQSNELLSITSQSTDTNRKQVVHMMVSVRLNHVRGTGGECGIVYSRRQNMPPQPGQSNPGMVSAGSWGLRSYYSFDYGPIHFLQYDSESPFALGTLQHQ